MHEFANDTISFFLIGSVAVGIGFAFRACLFGMRFMNVFATDRAARDLLRVCSGNVRENVIVDGRGGSMIAAAKTRHVANLHVFRPRIGEAALEIGAQLAGAVKMTAHVRADANFRFGRRDEMKMRIETCDAVNLVERRLSAL